MYKFNHWYSWGKRLIENTTSYILLILLFKNNFNLYIIYFLFHDDSASFFSILNNKFIHKTPSNAMPWHSNFLVLFERGYTQYNLDKSRVWKQVECYFSSKF